MFTIVEGRRRYKKKQLINIPNPENPVIPVPIIEQTADVMNTENKVEETKEIIIKKTSRKSKNVEE